MLRLNLVNPAVDSETRNKSNFLSYVFKNSGASHSLSEYIFSNSSKTTTERFLQSDDDAGEVVPLSSKASSSRLAALLEAAANRREALLRQKALHAQQHPEQRL